VAGSTSSITSRRRSAIRTPSSCPGSSGHATINKPPAALDEELHAVIAWLESQGGEPTISLKDKLPYCSGEAS